MKTIPGKCRCGMPVIKTEQTFGRAFRTNKDRYFYPESHEWDIFRCVGCEEVIEETFQADAEERQSGEGPVSDSRHTEGEGGPRPPEKSPTPSAA